MPKLNVGLKLKNRFLWIALTSLVLRVFVGEGILDETKAETYSFAIERFLEILVFLGFLNNPDTENRGLSDDQ